MNLTIIVITLIALNKTAMDAKKNKMSQIINLDKENKEWLINTIESRVNEIIDLNNPNQKEITREYNELMRLESSIEDDILIASDINAILTFLKQNSESANQ